MSCCGYCADFRKTVRYVSPAHGGWGVIRVAALVPESYLLFVAPFACGRHGALGGMESGIKDRISYLFIDESDIVSGNYENLIPDAVEELFAFLEKKPKVLFVFVSCLDDLLGTDHDALCASLEVSWPGVRFKTCHMNPFSMDTPNPPGVTLLDNMYSLLEKRNKKKKVLFAGNNVPLDADNDVIQLLLSAGFESLQIGNCTDYAEFSALSESCLNLLLRPSARKACRTMEKRLETPYLESWCSYDIKGIAAWYEKLADALKITRFDISDWSRRAESAVQLARQELADTPIAIDYQAVLLPFGLARALVTYGFNVQLVVVDECVPPDRENRQWLQEQCPDIRVCNAMHPDMVKYQLRGMECLCVGFDSGYMTGSTHTVSIMDDEGLFGFAGVIRLMELLRNAAGADADVRTLISEAKLII